MFTSLILVCSLLQVPRLADCDSENATQVAILQKTFVTRSECLRMGLRFGPDVLTWPMTPVEDRIKVVCVRTPFAAARVNGKHMPASVRAALPRVN